MLRGSGPSLPLRHEARKRLARSLPIVLPVGVAALLFLAPDTFGAKPHWQLADQQVDGMSGSVVATSLDDRGKLEIPATPSATTQIPPDTMATIDALIRRIHDEGSLLSSEPPDPCPRCSDTTRWQTTITYGGLHYWLSRDVPRPGAADVAKLQSLVEEIGAALMRRVDAATFQANNHFELGRAWRVTEIIRDFNGGVRGVIDETWTRRGDTRVFDSVWHNTITDRRGTDVLEMGPVERLNAMAGRLAIDARGGAERYIGGFDLGSDRRVTGTALGGYEWEAQILDHAPSPGEASERPGWIRGAYGPIESRPIALPPIVRTAPSLAPAPTFDDAIRVATGDSAACAVRVDGSVVCWAGTKDDAVLGGNLGPAVGVPRTVALPDPAKTARVVDLAVGSGFACVIKADRSVWCWGDLPLRADGPVLDASAPQSPRRIARSDGSPLRAVAMDIVGDRGCLVTDRGAVLCWGRPYGPPRDAADTSGARGLSRPLSGALDPASAAVQLGDMVACAMDKDHVACWGTNAFGELAVAAPEANLNEDIAPRLAAAGAVAPFRRLTVGTAHACIVDAGSRAWCWGSNQWHELGDPFAPAGSTIAVPFSSIAPSIVQALIATESSTCAIGSAAVGHSLLCTVLSRSPPQQRGDQIRVVSWGSGGTMTGVLQASIHGPNKCAVVARNGDAARSGSVACWGIRIGEPLRADSCVPWRDPGGCWTAKLVAAPVP